MDAIGHAKLRSVRGGRFIFADRPLILLPACRTIAVSIAIFLVETLLFSQLQDSRDGTQALFCD
jgi:hypothetical protein